MLRRVYVRGEISKSGRTKPIVPLQVTFTALSLAPPPSTRNRYENIFHREREAVYDFYIAPTFRCFPCSIFGNKSIDGSRNRVRRPSTRIKRRYTDESISIKPGDILFPW